MSPGVRIEHSNSQFCHKHTRRERKNTHIFSCTTLALGSLKFSFFSSSLLSWILTPEHFGIMHYSTVHLISLSLLEHSCYSKLQLNAYTGYFSYKKKIVVYITVPNFLLEC
jgi:hypothetical protein